MQPLSRPPRTGAPSAPTESEPAPTASSGRDRLPHRSQPDDDDVLTTELVGDELDDEDDEDDEIDEIDEDDLDDDVSEQ